MTFDHALKVNSGCFGFVSWAMLLFGALFTTSAVYQTWLPLAGTTADGVVTTIIAKSSSKSAQREGETKESYRKRSGGVSYDLVVKYTPEGGQPVEFKTASTFGLHVKEGDPVQVIYLKSNPMNAEINTVRQVWLPLFVGYTVSTLCLGGGLFLRRALRYAKAP